MEEEQQPDLAEGEVPRGRDRDLLRWPMERREDVERGGIDPGTRRYFSHARIIRDPMNYRAAVLAA